MKIKPIICVTCLTKMESSSNLAPGEGRRREDAALAVTGTITLALASFMNLTVLLVFTSVCLGSSILYFHAYLAGLETCGEGAHGKPFWKFKFLYYCVQHRQELGKEGFSIKFLFINIKNLGGGIKPSSVLEHFLINRNMNIQFVILEDSCAFSHASYQPDFHVVQSVIRLS